MSKVKIQGHASGTGVLTVTAPNTSTDRTITLPDSTDTLAVNSDVTNKLPLAGGTMTGDVTFADNIYAKFGTGNDLRIRHDGSNSYIAEMGTGDLIIQTNGADFLVENTDGDNMINAISDGAVELSYNNVKKLATTSTGVDVNGDITQTSGDYIYEGGGNFDIKHTIASQNIVFSTTPSGGSATERMRITSDGRGLSQFTAKSWVSFNGTGTIAINDSHNVSSVSDLNTGQYQVNFSNSMANANYSAIMQPVSIARANPWVDSVATGYFKIYIHQSTNDTYYDCKVNTVVFGD
jgi:hypothetical protein